MRRCLLGLAVGAMLATTAGCPSMTTLGSARTLDAGKTQFFVAPEWASFSMGGEPLRQPQVELGGRYGITDDIEVGAKLWLPGLELESKFAILRPEKDEGNWDLSVAPGISYIGGMSGTATGSGYELHVLTVYLGLPVGYRFACGNEIVVGPKLANQTWTTEDESGSTANLLYLGTSLSYLWHVTEGIIIAPEFAIASPMVESVPGFGTDVGIGAVLWQAGIAFLFGG